MTKLISEVIVDGDIVEDEVVEIEVAIVELVLVGIDCFDTMKKSYIKLSSNNVRKEGERGREKRERVQERFL